MAADSNSTLLALSGQVERITYCDQESGFTIAQINGAGNRGRVTVVGNLIAPAPGTILQMQGYWTQHPRFGRQFKVAQFETKIPATEQGILKYLGSGMISGLGPKFAQRIIDRFGDQTLAIFDEDIERLAEVDGIGPKRMDMIRSSWDKQKEIRNVMLFLQSHGVSTAYVTKIFKQYGQRSIATVQENPYRLADDIFGIGFLTADRIAAQLGFANNSPQRIQAGILYVLHQLAGDGHVYFPYEELITKAQSILKSDRDAIVVAMGSIAAEKQIIIEDLNADMQDFKPNLKAVYLAKYHLCETAVARRLRMLLSAPLLRPDVNAEGALAWLQKHLRLKLAQSQAKAVTMALKHKVMVITGGPGTGKTTIIQAITRLYERLGAKVLLAAPTGRAAKRLSETTARPAKTLHRLLEYNPALGGFQRRTGRPLDGELLIVDEASMIDTVLMHHLLKAVPLHTTFILVGDVNQLPSVGPGNVLKDIIASQAVPVVTLDNIFRQALSSQIVVNAHRINDGHMPRIDHANEDPCNDFYFIEQEEADRILEIILTLVTERIPHRFNLNPVDAIQVLTPMHRGVVGAENLNRRLQQVLNPQEEHVISGEQCFRLHDKVMQIRNNYNKEVFNGDIGRIDRIDARNRTVLIRFDQRPVEYDFNDLDEIVLAYAVSVHKSQGSEYPAVVVPITTQHYVLLQRNLLYTAVTRARQLVVLVGTKRALAMAIKNNRPQKRYTRMDERLSM